MISLKIIYIYTKIKKLKKEISLSRNPKAPGDLWGFTELQFELKSNLHKLINYLIFNKNEC